MQGTWVQSLVNPAQGTKIPHAAGQLGPRTTTTEPVCSGAHAPQRKARAPQRRSRMPQLRPNAAKLIN